jgi:hypothetical protein
MMSQLRPIALSASMYRRRGSMCMSDRMARRWLRHRAGGPRRVWPR